MGDAIAVNRSNEVERYVEPMGWSVVTEFDGSPKIWIPCQSRYFNHGEPAMEPVLRNP